MIFGKKGNTQSTVKVQVNRAHVSVAPPVSLSLEDDMWDPRVKKVKGKRKRKRSPRVLMGSKGTRAGSAAQLLGSVWRLGGLA